MQNMLDRIIAHKAREVENAKVNLPISEIEVQARMASAPRGFVKNIYNTHQSGRAALIAEIKKASPSKGLIREHFDPAALAVAYENGGAACISVLTDVPFFQGHPIYLKEVRSASSLPVLRKDFMIDPYQVVEARAWGADCILVIMAAVDDSMANNLTNVAREWGMDVLIEVHNRQELERALQLDSVLIGINNRNLQTFEIKLEVTEGLAPLIPHDRIVVSESGIFKHEDLTRLSHVGVQTYLVGECLMRQDDVESATRRLLGISPLETPPQPSDQPARAEADGSDDAEDPHPVSQANAESHAEKLSGAKREGQKDTEDDFQAAVQELGAMIGATVGEPPEAEAQARRDSAVEKGTDSLADAPPLAGAGNKIQTSIADAISSKDKKVAGDAKTAGDANSTGKLSHVNEAGAAHMVDISAKDSSQRIAVAEGYVTMQPDTLAQIQQNAMKKGDVLSAARLAGIMAAKKTADLIPLCHPLQLTGVDVDFTPFSHPTTGIRVAAKVKVDGKTGVEMEALTAVSVACLTIYDMAKAIDKGMSFSGIRLLEKTGGKSGVYRAPDAAE